MLYHRASCLLAGSSYHYHSDIHFSYIIFPEKPVVSNCSWKVRERWEGEKKKPIDF